MNPKEENAGKVSVELDKPHEHEGRQYKPGDTINVWPDQAEWLRSIKVAKGGPGMPAGLAVAPKPAA